MTGASIHPPHTSQLLARQYDELRTEARAAMKQATTVAAEELRRLAPGHIGEHIEERIGSSPGMVTGTVFLTDRGARFADEGTGIYVEFHEPIGVKPARRAANPRAAMQIAPGVFRRRVKGQRPQRFIERAAEAAEPRVDAILDRPASTVPGRLKA